MCKFACESVCTCFCRTLYNSGSFPIFSAPPSTWVIYRWVWDFVEMGWGGRGALCETRCAREQTLCADLYHHLLCSECDEGKNIVSASSLWRSNATQHFGWEIRWWSKGVASLSADWCGADTFFSERRLAFQWVVFARRQTETNKVAVEECIYQEDQIVYIDITQSDTQRSAGESIRRKSGWSQIVCGMTDRTAYTMMVYDEVGWSGAVMSSTYNGMNGYNS